MQTITLRSESPTRIRKQNQFRLISNKVISIENIWTGYNLTMSQWFKKSSKCKTNSLFSRFCSLPSSISNSQLKAQTLMRRQYSKQEEQLQKKEISWKQSRSSFSQRQFQLQSQRKSPSRIQKKKNQEHKLIHFYINTKYLN